MYKNYAKIRDSKGLTDYAIAKGTGISSGTFGDWKKGNYQPKIDKLKKIADFLDVPLDLIINGDESEQESDSGKKYYFSDDTAQAAQEMFENKELRALYDVQRDMDSEDLKALYNMALALKRKERGNDEC